MACTAATQQGASEELSFHPLLFLVCDQQQQLQHLSCIAPFEKQSLNGHTERKHKRQRDNKPR